MSVSAAFGVTTCPDCLRTVEVSGGRVLRHRVKFSDGMVGDCPMSNRTVNARSASKKKPKKKKAN